MNKLFKLSNNIVKYFFAFFAILFFIGNVFFTARINELESNAVKFNFGLTVINIFIVLIILFVLYYLIKNNFFNISERKFLITFLIFCTVIGLIWVFINDPIIRELADSYNCFDRAKTIASGDFSPLGFKTYISMYPNNLGFITYLIILIKVFGEMGALYASRIINLVFVLIGYWSLYKITDIQFSSNRLVNCSLVYLCFFSTQFVLYSFMVYGNCVSYGAGLLSVYLLLKYFNDNKISNLLLSIITIVLSITIKNNSLIILVAEIIFIILYILKNKKWKVIFAIIIMLIGTWLGTTGIQKFWGYYGEMNYGKTKLPTICWIAYGFNYDQDKPGTYINEFESFHFNNGFVQEYTSLNAKAFIGGTFDRFKQEPLFIFKFYGEKFLSAWCNPEYDAFSGYIAQHNNEVVESFVGGTANEIIVNIWDGAISVIAIGLVVYIIKNFKNIKLNELLPATIIIGGFLFHSFWEIKAIYLYQYFMYILPYAAYGLVCLLIKQDKVVK